MRIPLGSAWPLPIPSGDFRWLDTSQHGGTSGPDDELLLRQVVTDDGKAFLLVFCRRRDAVFRHAGQLPSVFSAMI
jgi:hypothetical protein